MLYIPAILVLALCAYTQHDVTPAIVAGIVSGFCDIVIKALPGRSRWASPSGAIQGSSPPPAWALATRRLAFLVWAITLTYCGHWAAQ